MAAGRALPRLVFLLVACNGDKVETADTGFRVTWALPEDGSMDAPVSVNPQIGFSAAVDNHTCTTSTVSMAVINEDYAITASVDYSLLIEGESHKIILDTIDELPRNFWYAFTLRSGWTGCTDEKGRVVRPFTSRFFVP